MKLREVSHNLHAEPKQRLPPKIKDVNKIKSLLKHGKCPKYNHKSLVIPSSRKILA